MLRLRPTAISLTRADVTELVHRRRFRRFLECEDEEMYNTFTPAETEATLKATPFKPSSSRVVDQGATPPTCSGIAESSPPSLHNPLRPPIPDLPLLLPPGKAAQDDVSSRSAVSAGRGRRSGARDELQQSSPWTLQLCLRPKRSFPLVTTAVVDVSRDGLESSRDLVEMLVEEPIGDRQKTEQDIVVGNPKLIWDPRSRSAGVKGRVPSQSTLAHGARDAMGRTHARSKSEAGPSRHDSSPIPSISNSTPPALSHLASPEPFDDSGDGPPSEGSRSGIPSRMLTYTTPGRLRVYDDSLPASSQPQTPQNLPEARHQSRLHGSYTAPARRASPRPTWTPTRDGSRYGAGRRRDISPPGIQTPGFRGLYGGMENMDEGVLAEEIANMARAETSRPSSISR